MPGTALTGLGIDMHPTTAHHIQSSGVHSTANSTNGPHRGTRAAPRAAFIKPSVTTSMIEDSVRAAPQPPTSLPSLVPMRSAKSMAGLLLAEVGASMVEIDRHASPHASGFREGKRIEPGAVTPIVARPRPARGSTTMFMKNSLEMGEPGVGAMANWSAPAHRRTMSADVALARHGTLLSAQASPTRRAAELKALLGSDASAKVKSGAVAPGSSAPNTRVKKPFEIDAPEAVKLEQGRSRVRVSLDLELENAVAVEGGCLSGLVHVRVRPKGKEDMLSLGGGKIRIAGFEVAPGNEDRHIFYQFAAPLEEISNMSEALYVGPTDSEGLGPVGEGEYKLNFSMRLPTVHSGGKPKGSMVTRSGAAIRYIAIVSMKIVDPNTGKRSIAHFYRDCEIWPVLDPVSTLAASPQPLYARTEKKLFMGGDGTLALSAALQRMTWIAGQPVHVRVRVSNETRKTVRAVGLVLLRTTTLFRPSSKTSVAFGSEDPDACETETSEKKIAECALVSGQKGAKGHASAKGWWTGVRPGEKGTVGHSIVIPSDALTVQRARLVEVEYALRVSLSVGSLTGTSEAVHVVLPIRIVNFISLDPPPSEPLIVATSSSVITLDTPRADIPDSRSFNLEPSATRSMLKAQPMVASLSMNITDDQRKPRHNASKPSHPMESSMRARQKPNTYYEKPLPVPMLSTANNLHDLGSVESADDLDCILGDIPGSVSILEESDIAAASTLYDSGYSEETANDSDGDVSGDQAFASDSYGYEGEEEDSEDVGSDEELERMVECASTTLGSSASCAVPYGRGNTTGRGILLNAPDPALRSDGQYASGIPAHSSNNIASKLAGDAGHQRKSKQSRRGYQEPDETIGICSTDVGAIHATSSMVRISKQSLDTHENSSSTQSMIPIQRHTAGPRTNRAIPSLKYGPRPSAQRSLTAPRPYAGQPESSVRRNAVGMEPSLLSSMSAAQGVSDTAAGRLGPSGGSTGQDPAVSTVRARIAMLEQRSKEECLSNDGQGFGQPTFGGRARSMTTS